MQRVVGCLRVMFSRFSNAPHSDLPQRCDGPVWASRLGCAAAKGPCSSVEFKECQARNKHRQLLQPLPANLDANEAEFLQAHNAGRIGHIAEQDSI